MFRRPSYRKRVYLGCGFAFLGQSTGGESFAKPIPTYPDFVRKPEIMSQLRSDAYSLT